MSKTDTFKNTLSDRECVFLALGSNQGDRKAFLDSALDRLKQNGFRILAVSAFYETEPVNCVADAGPFLNGVVCGEWDDTPESLLELCQRLERESGRPADHTSQQSRNLDLDMILYGNRIISSKCLCVPHPRAQQREFVLEPLTEIAPEVIFPDTGKSAWELLHDLKRNFFY